MGYFTERRRRITRRHTFTSISTYGSRTGTGTPASAILKPPYLVLSTGSAGANRLCQVCEGPGGEVDLFDRLTLGTRPYWSLEQYASVFMGQHTASLTGKNARMYAALELQAAYGIPPYPEDGSIQNVDQVLQVRARMSDGAWELFQSNALVSQINVLAGLPAFPIEQGVGCRLEVSYKPNGNIVVTVDDIAAAPVASIMDATRMQDHFGAGCLVTSGDNGAGICQAWFADLLTEVILP